MPQLTASFAATRLTGRAARATVLRVVLTGPAVVTLRVKRGATTVATRKLTFRTGGRKRLPPRPPEGRDLRGDADRDQRRDAVRRPRRAADPAGPVGLGRLARRHARPVPHPVPRAGAQARRRDRPGSTAGSGPATGSRSRCTPSGRP